MPDHSTNCYTCGKEMKFNYSKFRFCKSCRQTRGDEYYLDNGAFSQTKERKDRRSYDREI